MTSGSHGHTAAVTDTVAPQRPRSIQELVQASNFYFDQTPSLTSYVRGAKNLRRQSSVYEKEGDYETAFIMLTRSVKLVLDHIPRHREFAKADGVVNQQLLKTSRLSMEDMKRLKPKLKDRYERWEARRLQESSHAFEQGSISAYEARDAGYENPSWLNRKVKGMESKVLSGQHNQPRRISSDATGALPQTVPPSSNAVPYIPFVAPFPTPSPSLWSTPAVPTIYQGSPFYTPFIPYTPAWDPVRQFFDSKSSAAGVLYPDIKHSTRQKPQMPTMTSQQADRRVSMKSTEVPKQTFLQRSIMRPLKHEAEKVWSARTEGGIPLRNVVLPADMVDTFAALALENTRRNLETCGLIMGQLSRNVLTATLLLIPKQTATSDTCTTQNEEDIFAVSDARDVITLGWIHTHPRQSCFLSSVDLHTHYSYQQMLPEAIAVVVAPTSSPSIGIFRITDPPGLSTIGSCKEKGLFHPHPDVPLYTDADGMHVRLQKGLDLEVIDVR